MITNTCSLHTINILGCVILDDDLRSWLKKSLGIRKGRFHKRLFSWLRPRTQLEKRGRPSLNTALRQLIFDVWIENSTISVDRRDGRDMFRIPMRVFREKYHDIETSLVSIHTSKCNQEMDQAPRYMCHVTIRKIKEILKEKHNVSISLGSAHDIQPFFVVTPSDREKLECLCTTCCNARLTFDAVQRCAKRNNFRLYTSITSYFTGDMECSRDRNGYHAYRCINGDCDNCRGIIKPQEYLFKSTDAVSYYQFESVATGRLNSKGKPMKKTKRNDYSCVSASSCKNNLDLKADEYLMHRYNVENNKFMWPLILEKCEELGEVIVHMDYSENIKEKPKIETQSHHFSGQQHSLHCAVVQTSNENWYYYHFSNERVHDWQFTKADVMEFVNDIFQNQEIICLKSDNCATQYKCAKVFVMYCQLSVTLNKRIIIYFGAAGHGRGLVDGMSSFGVKTPLRFMIITKDLAFCSRTG